MQKVYVSIQLFFVSYLCKYNAFFYLQQQYAI